MSSIKAVRVKSSMVVLEAAALAGALRDLFMYNRQNFMFDKDQNLERVYMTQKMRVEQVALYREDVRDLFGLTIAKMDNYLVINTLALGFCLAFFYEGKLPAGTPSWLVYLWAMSLGSAILFLALSVFFAIHASITAQTFAVRLLTQWLRLPVPGADEVKLPAVQLQDFERAGGKSILRIPVLGRLPLLSSGRSNSKESCGPDGVSRGASVSNPALEELKTEYDIFMEHFFLFSQLQTHWQGFDAFSRVCMVVGSSFFLHGVIYLGLAYYHILLGEGSTWVVTLLLTAASIIILRINLVMSTWNFWLLWVSTSAGPLLSTVLTSMQLTQGIGDSFGTTLALWTSPFIFLLHGVGALLLMRLGLEKDGQLPTRFSTVVSIDVLGLQRKPEDAAGAGSSEEDTSQSFFEGNELSLREAPVSDLIPQNVALKKSFEASKARQNLSQAFKNNPYKPSRAESAHVQGKEGPTMDRIRSENRAASTPEMHSRSISKEYTDNSWTSTSALPQGDSLAGGVAVKAPTSPGLTKAAEKAQLAPWLAYKVASGTVLCLWVSGMVISLIVLGSSFDWGWDSSLQQPAHHRRRLMDL